MESHMLQLLVDQAEREVEAALQAERDAETQLRLLRKEMLAQRAVVRDLENALRKAQQVRNIIMIIDVVTNLPTYVVLYMYCMYNLTQYAYAMSWIYNLSTSVADPGSGIGCLFGPWIRDPGWEKVSIRIRDPG
jgi:hypothetical protein